MVFLSDKLVCGIQKVCVLEVDRCEGLGYRVGGRYDIQTFNTGMGSYIHGNRVGEWVY